MEPRNTEFHGQHQRLEPHINEKTGPSKHKKLAWIALIAFVVALAIGLGVGLGLKSRDEGGNDTSNAPLPTLTPQPPGRWQPGPGTKWQIILESPIDLASDATNTTPADAPIWDIDLFTNSNETIKTLQRLGKKVICYFSAGSYEPNRPDSNQFKPEDLGKELQGWPGEKWLNLNSPNVRKIMTNRITFAQQKGCDGVDPDNVDAYDNENGLGLTANDSIAFMGFLSTAAHKAGMSIGLKNAAAILPNVVMNMEWSVNEQCVQYGECSKYAPMIQNGKPVFHIEYPNQVDGNTQVSSSLCKTDGQAAGAQGFSTVLKNDDLDGYVKYCDNETATTDVISS
jgi:hypothetical protein